MLKTLSLFVPMVLVGACQAAPEKNGSGAAAGGPDTGKADEAVVVTPSGLKYIDQRIGNGETAQPGMNVRVHYTAWLKDGKKFDSSVDRHEPFDFTLGAHQVIKGWDEGVASMRVGGKRRLIIPPYLGYGERGAGRGLIPPNAELTFDVELLAVNPK